MRLGVWGRNNASDNARKIKEKKIKYIATEVKEEYNFKRQY
jgi:hypothetical protein